MHHCSWYDDDSKNFGLKRCALEVEIENWNINKQNLNNYTHKQYPQQQPDTYQPYLYNCKICNAKIEDPDNCQYCGWNRQY